MIIISGIFFVLASALILYLFAVGNWLLASISALGLFILYVELERKESEKAHAAAMKAERDRAKADRAERLAEALRELVSASDGSIEYVDDEDEIGYLPCCGALSYKPHEDDCPVTKARAALRDYDEGRPQ